MKIHMIRGIAAFLLTVCFVSGANAPTYAVDNTSIIEPYYTGAINERRTLSISSGKATCKGYLTLRSGYTASLTLKLQQSNNGSSWTTLKTWTATGRIISKSYYVSSEYKYRATFNIKVYNSEGTLVDNFTKISETKP